MLKINFPTLLSLLGLLLSSQLTAQFVQEKSIAANEPAFDNQQMKISVVDASSQSALETDVNVYGLNPRKPITLESVADTTFEIRNYRLYTVSCIRKGYMYYSSKFWPDEKALHLQEVALRPLEVGLKTDVRDITFLGDKTEIYHKSKPALGEIIEFLKLNPTVSIAVIGHVNGPDNSRSQRFYEKASLARAEAVREYLINEGGIDERRLTAKGAGNAEMIYTDPVTDWQNQANRRIEIEVTGL